METTEEIGKACGPSFFVSGSDICPTDSAGFGIGPWEGLQIAVACSSSLPSGTGATTVKKNTALA